jgi:hypothetical protein
MPDENTDFSTTKDFKVGDCIFVIEEKHSQRVFGMYLQQDLPIFIAGEPSQNTFDVKKFGPNCKLVSTCGDLVSVDCGAAVDGSFDYVNIKTNEVVSSCGGNCMSPESREYCKANCPPKEWKCNKAIK